MVKSSVRNFIALGIIFTGVFFLTSGLFKNYVNKELASEAAVFQYLLKEEGVVFEANRVIDYLDLLPVRLDIIVIDAEAKKPVYVEISDDAFVFSNSKALTKLIKNVDLEKNLYATVENKRVLIGRFTNGDKPYIYALIRDVSDINLYLSWLIITFVMMSFLAVIWNYYNTNNIVDTLLMGLNEITNSANDIKGKNLSKRIEITSTNDSIGNLIFTLNSMLDRVENSFIRISEFTDNVSHELKTPIMSIKSMIEVELSSERTVEEYQEDLGKVLDEVNWLNNIIQKLLIFTKNPESLEEHFRPVKIEKMILELCEFMDILTLEKEITLNCQLEDSEIEVLGEESLLRDIFLNIISNSIKYNKDGGEINITSFILEDKIGIRISDTGIGIKDKNLKKITERFFREDKVRTTKKSGSGLGLSIVSHLVEVHRGTLEIESTEGAGSVFTVYLPKV
ncbi:MULTISPECIES: sensor histidine kinase [Psychrilyobacter]|uniref:histidine kinase n=1 Tax=Psychrilyobacter piezotolerans TaxID=2293438 RepID=A0ABX9KDC1_9FUSO|nr:MULTISPECIES: HAMP domain-containing sensor histidine kinase [Psychrilyobacter]MCS5422673.1 HAMP domain-containing histidine kinase [Psychrilyobacter sp. S5]NDI79201.1 HAMP domain-containing histidine kinase [Psychrilyobacter piezotolerans]RDE58882.1 sensor histidine kinase [Psychrilyobacter sp. S5]REI39392.1 sensor histidine kinase [Psychrilyobacter piezotolerans]